MPLYSYQAKKKPGELVHGHIDAASLQEALSKIDSLGLFPLSVREQQPLRKITRISLKEQVEFTHQLSTLINSGSTLLGSLNTLLSETEQVRFKPILLDIVAHVKEGEHFSDALKRYPGIFSPFYVSLVQVGETSGTLGESLKRIAQFLEDDMEFRTNIISIFTYPLFVVGLGILTVFVLLKFVIPKLVSIFQEIGQTLPLATQILITVSALFSRYWIILFLVAGGIFFMVKHRLKKEENRVQWDKRKLKLPLIGGLLKKIEACRFSQTFAVLLRNGVPVDTALEIVAVTITNCFFRKEIQTVKQNISHGFSLNGAMKKTEVFSPSFINVVTVGEESGTLEEVLENLSADYRKEINRQIKTVMNILEPALILCVGLIVGFVVLAMLLPIFQIDFNF